MASKVVVFELQNDLSVTQREAPLTFPRASKSRLCIITNQNSQLHLLNNSGGSPRAQEGGGAVQEKTIFQHGVSTKVFAVMDASGTEWEVRMLLSPLEISRLSSSFNLTGFVSGCLTEEKYQDSFSSFCGHHPKHEADVQELCKAAAHFLSYSEDDIVNDYCKELNRDLTEKVGASCIGQQKMVVGALVALVAAELATSIGGTGSFDYKVQKEKTLEDQSEQIQEIIKVFDVMADLLTVSHQGKRVQIIFRNPCPDNWASGGKKLVNSGETFEFGLCHKLVSISEAQSEIQFLQSFQESYDLVPVFHLPAFVEHLLMTSAWRNKIELFLKEQDQRKEILHELASLAVRFICSKMCHQETFLEEFQRTMLEKWSGVEAVLVGDEVVCSFGILVAILAAVLVKASVDRCSPDSEEVEDSEEPTAEPVDTFRSAGLETNVSASFSKIYLDDDFGSYEEVTIKVSDEYGGGQPDLCSIPSDWVKVEYEIGEVGIVGAESKIGNFDDPETTNKGSFNSHLKTEEHFAALSAVTTLDIANQEKDYDDAGKNLVKYAGIRDDAHESSITSPEAEGSRLSQNSSGSPSLDDSMDDRAYRGVQRPNVGTRDNAHECSPTSSEAEGSHHSDGPSLDDFKDYGAYTVAQLSRVGAQDNAHKNCPTSPEAERGNQSQGSSSGPSLDNSKDDRAYTVDKPPAVGAQDNAHESSLSCLEAEGDCSIQGSSGSPSVDDYKDDEGSRLPQPPIAAARDNALESHDSSSGNRVLYTCFIGLVCFLLFAMLTNVLPQPMIAVLVAIILGLLVVKWQLS